MRNFHSEAYPNLKRVLVKIGKDLSTSDFKITIYALTKEKETQFSSSYAFKIKVETPDDVSEEETERQIGEKDWQQIITERLCEYYPDARKEEDGLYIPQFRSAIRVPDSIFSKYSLAKKD